MGDHALGMVLSKSTFLNLHNPMRSAILLFPLYKENALIIYSLMLLCGMWFTVDFNINV